MIEKVEWPVWTGRPIWFNIRVGREASALHQAEGTAGLLIAAPKTCHSGSSDDMGTIHDFEDGTDMIALVGGSDGSFADIQNSMIQSGSDVIIHVDDSYLSILDANLSQVSASDFLFA